MQPWDALFELRHSLGSGRRSVARHIRGMGLAEKAWHLGVFAGFGKPGCF